MLSCLRLPFTKSLKHEFDTPQRPSLWKKDPAGHWSTPWKQLKAWSNAHPGEESGSTVWVGWLLSHCIVDRIFCSFNFIIFAFLFWDISHNVILLRLVLTLNWCFYWQWYWKGMLFEPWRKICLVIRSNKPWQPYWPFDTLVHPACTCHVGCFK